MKKNIFKSFLYIFCAFCFLSLGITTLHQSEKTFLTLAENTSSDRIENETMPIYFSVSDKLKNDSISPSDATNPNSLIASDTLLYFQEAAQTNYLSISLLQNGTQVNTSGHEIYDYCFYPNTDDKTTFYFYKVGSVNLFINGENQNITKNDYVEETTYSFEGYPTLDKLTMNFSDAVTSGNNFSIKDSATSKIIEGVYQVSLTIDLFTVTGSAQDLHETNISDSSKTINYYFYVLDRENFFALNNPKVTNADFDKALSSSSSTSAFSYYLYSNYSKYDALYTTKPNKIPYIEYDYTRFEPTITKSIDEVSKTTKLLLDLDAYKENEAPVVLSGAETITKIVDKDNHTCKVFFYDVGDYRVSLDAINIVENNGVYKKYVVDGLSQKLQDFMVYVYGFQARYTDVDLPLDQNGMRQTSELKEYKLETDTLKILQSADITSKFLASKSAYSQENASTTFLISNVLDYIQSVDTSGSEPVYTQKVLPVQTNQTPISFVANATLNEATNAYRYVFTTASTAKTNSRYTETDYNINGDTLYRATFTGRADSAVGKYIYFIPYTFNGYRSSASTLDTTSVFYQVFYFEITTGLPNVSIKTIDETPVSNTEFTNKDVTITNNTIESPFNKKVTIQIYAWDFENNVYLEDFGGDMGKSFTTLDTNNDNVIELSENAKYIVRLYYAHKAANTNINLKNSASEQYYFRERSFTIDKTKIEGIKARNTTEITNSTSYRITTDLDFFSTNQDFVVSWDEKKSGASTYAYYRYFKLEQARYFSINEAVVSSTLNKWINENGNIFNHPELDSYIPVNYVVDLDTTNNNWIRYAGNTEEFENLVESEYVFADAGLYLIEVFDAAGNYSVDVFMLDNSSPNFAVYEIGQTNPYKLPPSSTYITSPSNVIWAKYKTIFVSGLPNSPSMQIYTSSTITEELLSGKAVYQDYNGNTCIDIYKTLYDKLFDNNYLQYHKFTGLSVNHASNGDDVDDRISTDYEGYYIAIPIESVSYYTDAEHPEYTKQTDVYYHGLTTETAMEYCILIRDKSNTKYDQTEPKDHVNQYKDFCSAYQTIIISFDDSKFFVDYMVDDERIVLESNTRTKTEIETGKWNETIYLNPISLETALNLSFLPTTSNDVQIQVESVIIKYYPYKTTSKLVGGKTYYYREISDSPIEIPVYTYSGTPQTTIFSHVINKDLGITTAGKYVITRTYRTEDGFSYNPKDTYQKTYVLYVDRNEVIENTERVGSGDNAHFESLVGGDIFVAMYDNSNLVVTFPNSYEANSNSASLYNNGTTIKPVLTTNQLPLNVYIPAYKYTSHVLKTANTFSVTNHETMNFHYEDVAIPEYKLFANIYKFSPNEMVVLDQNHLIARSNGEIENGFLKFFEYNSVTKTTTQTQLSNVHDAGTYYVEIIQGYYGTNRTGFKSSNIFCFDIKSVSPDFEAQSQQRGTTLESIKDATPYTYYTNQSNVRLVWKAETENSYMAEIDISEIKIECFDKNGGKIGEPIKATNENFGQIFIENPKIDGENWIATISLEKLHVYENGGYVDITMQYKNHNTDYYRSVKKRIVVDLTAPSDNINNLVSIVTSNTSIVSLTESAIRTYYTAKDELTTDVEKASYNYSNNAGIFAYYSYVVDASYLQTLKACLANTDPTSHYKTYIRKFVDEMQNNTKYVEGELQETTEFLPSNFMDIETISALDKGYYYEVVELDRAGNTATYTIYVSDRTTPSQKLIEYSIPEDDTIVSKSFDTKDFVDAKANSTNNNIYSKTGFRLDSINFFGDAWTEMEVKAYSPNGAMQKYIIMLTPWNNQAYSFVLSTYTRIDLSSLINGNQSSNYKNSIKILDKLASQTNGAVYENFYISIFNADFYSRSSLSTSKNAEYIMFVQPNDNLIKSTTTSSIFLNSIKITAGEDEIYSKENKLGLSSIWLGFNNSEEKVTISTNSNYLIFTLNENTSFAPNTRIVYEFEDNYGTKYKRIHLYQETTIEKEIDSENDLYSYYDISNGRLYYITKDGFKYTYNQNKYDYKLYEAPNGTIQRSRLIKTSITGDETLIEVNDANARVETSTQNNIQTLTIKTKETRPYNNTYAFEITDKQDKTNVVQIIYFTLYDELPVGLTFGTTYNIGEFVVLDTNNNNITSSVIDNTSGYFSKIKVLYSLADTFIPVIYSISTDKQTWIPLESGQILSSQDDDTQTYYLKIWYDEKYLKNEGTNADYIFENVPQVQIFELNLSALTSTYWIEKTIGGQTTIVPKSNIIYRTQNAQYSNHYITNVAYSNKSAIEIKTNDEQKIREFLVETFNDGDGVWTEIYNVTNIIPGLELGNIPAFSTTIAISYVPKSSTFVTEMFASDADGRINESKNLVRETSETIVVGEGSSTDKLELRWTKYYGNQNEIKIEITKDSIRFDPTIYTKTIGTKVYSYIILNRSGKYSIQLKDSSDDQNIETFNYGNAGQTETFTLIFLKDVPFMVEYRDVTSNETKTALPINEAVYNGEIKIKLDPSTLAEFYSASGYPTLNKEDSDGNLVGVKRNGVYYTGYYQDGYDYIFAETGYYEITFSAISKLYGAGSIREQTYAFTILNGDEYKYSYIYNSFSNYYVEKIIKNGVDVTEILTKTLNTKKISVLKGNTRKTYLSGLALSYLDEKTGSGTYIITINSNDELLKNSSCPDSFTFITKIKVGVAPLKVSISEGGETTSPISVAFNRTNIYKEMGECTLRVVRYENGRFYYYYNTEINSTTTGETSTRITDAGTYFVQILSPSGNLLYSYKVIKNEPLNAAAIIAIVISVIVFIAVVIIVVKLRKRISVK